MSKVTGSFDSVGNPTIRITVSGSIDGAKQQFEAIIDTGFTGFLWMPLVQAIPLGLRLYGTTSLTLADGSTITNLVATGQVSISQDRLSTGVIVLQTSSSEVLVGMDFIRALGPMLVVYDKRLVALLNEAEAEKLLGR
jgi:clan AA aspartic protease